jgi:hypothetical protein
MNSIDIKFINNSLFKKPMKVKEDKNNLWKINILACELSIIKYKYTQKSMTSRIIKQWLL